MVLATSYTYKTSAACAGACASNRRHQMDKASFRQNLANIVIPLSSGF